MSFLTELNGEKLTQVQLHQRNRWVEELLNFAALNGGCFGCKRNDSKFPWRGNIHAMRYHEIANWHRTLINK